MPPADTVRDDDRPLTMSERMEVAKEVVKAPKKRVYTDIPPPIQPKPGFGEAHEKAMEAVRLRKQKDVKKHQPKFAEDVLHYVECPDENCLGPAFWIWGNPYGLIENSRWEAAYKPRNAGWYSEGLPHCQCCKQRTGADVPARVFSVRRGERMVGFSVNPRFLREADDDLKSLFNTKE